VVKERPGAFEDRSFGHDEAQPQRLRIVGSALDSAVEAGGIIVSDEVSLELDIELLPPSQAGIVGPAKPK